MIAVQSFNQSTNQYYAALLTGNKGISAFLRLHHLVLASLPATKTHFLKRRLYCDLATHLTHGHHLVAIYNGNQDMVAQALVTYPNLPGTKNLDGYPFSSDLPADDCVVLQSVGIHPKWRKKGLRDDILTIATQIAEETGRTHVIAKMSADNQKSVLAFAKNGFAAHKTNNETQFMLKSRSPFEITSGCHV